MSDTAGPRVNGEIQNANEEMHALEELKKYEALIESADTEKSRLLLEKIEAEKEKKDAQAEIENLTSAGDKRTHQFNKDIQAIQEDMKSIDKANEDLLKELESLQNKYKLKRAETDSLQQKFKIKAKIPVKRVKFTHVDQEERDEKNEHIASVFTVTQRPSILLKGGQALITFEEEKVAEQILRLAKCTVACDKNKMDVKPFSLTLEPSVKFEVHIEVSKKTVEFHNAPPTLPDERMRDRLELSFSRPSRGGGEVEKVDYDKQTGTGHVTFLKTGVAENLVLKRKFPVDTGSDMVVDVYPLYMYKLKKFQTFSGSPNRTVLLKGIQDVMDEEDLQDHLEIHFQKPSNYGGEVENIKYVPAGNELTAFFSEDSAGNEA